MTPIEEHLTAVMRTHAQGGPPVSTRQHDVWRRVHAVRRRRALATGTAVTGVAAVAAIAAPLISSHLGPAAPSAPFRPAAGGPPASGVLPPPPYNDEQAIATLSGAGKGWTDGTHTLSVRAGGTLAVTTECYGAGTLTVAVGPRAAMLNTQNCDTGERHTLMLAKIVPAQYASLGITDGQPVTIAVTRSGGDSDQWRLQVQRDPDLGKADAVPSS